MGDEAQQTTGPMPLGLLARRQDHRAETEARTAGLGRVRKVTPWMVRKVTPWMVRKVTPWIDGIAPLTDNVGRDQDRGGHVRREQMSWHTEHG